MRIKKEISLCNTESISIEYTNSHFNAGDTAVAIYNKYKISLILSNGINAVTNNNVINCSKNCVLFFRPDELHFGRIANDGMYSYLDIFIPLSFFPKLGDTPASIKFLNDYSKSRINCIHFDFENKIKIQNICSEILNILNSPNTSYVELFSLVLQIVVICNELYENQKTNLSNCEIPPIVTTTMMYISENFAKDLSLKTLAANANCSVAYLSRIFKQYTGMTLYSYITSIRISKAQALLNQGLSVTQTCFSCGFNDCSNFIGKFKALTGLTPGEFQKNPL